MDLRDWIRTEHAEVRQRFDAQVRAHVAHTRWRERDGRSSSVAWLVLHAAYHQDLALSTAILGQPPAMVEHRAALGLEVFDPTVGIGEEEDGVLTALVDLAALERYADAVHDATAAWLDVVDLGELDAVPPSSARLVEQAGVPVEALPWFHAMWDAKPVAWLVRWECIGHPMNHVGELVALRNRMGLSPF
jgi:hypothetical protein